MKPAKIAASLALLCSLFVTGCAGTRLGGGGCGNGCCGEGCSVQSADTGAAANNWAQLTSAQSEGEYFPAEAVTR